MSWWETQTWKHGWKGRRRDHFWLESNLSCTYVLHTFAICSFLPPPQKMSSVVPISFLPTTQSSGIGDGERSRDFNPTLSPLRISHQPGTDFCTKLHPLPSTILQSQPVLGLAKQRSELWSHGLSSSMCEPRVSRV